MDEIVILAIDDHQLFTDGLGRLITESFPLAQYIALSGLGTAIAGLENPPNLILLDFNLNGITGLSAVAQARQHWPHACIFILTSEPVHEIEHQLVDFDDVQVVSKAVAHQTLVNKIRQALALDACEQVTNGQKLLSPRQLEVLRYLREGRSNKAIAERMGLSEFTVRGHVQQLFKAIGAGNRTNAVYLAEQARLI